MSEEKKGTFDLLKANLPITIVCNLLIFFIGVAVTIATGVGWNNAIVAANAKAIDNLPNTYVTKAEFNATMKSMTDSLNRIDKNIENINQTLLKYNFEIPQYEKSNRN